MGNFHQSMHVPEKLMYSQVEFGWFSLSKKGSQLEPVQRLDHCKSKLSRFQLIFCLSDLDVKDLCYHMYTITDWKTTTVIACQLHSTVIIHIEQWTLKIITESQEASCYWKMCQTPSVMLEKSN